MYVFYELTSRGDGPFLYTPYIPRKEFMAEVRNEHIQNHLEERKRIKSKTRRDKTPKHTIPVVHTPHGTYGSFSYVMDKLL